MNITNDSVLIRTTPTRSTNISKNVTYFYYGNGVFFVFPNATTATWNDTKIVLDTNVKKGTQYVMKAGNDTVNLTIGNISASSINVSAEFQGSAQSLTMNKTVIFNRTYFMPRFYKLPFDYMGYPLAQIVLGDDVKKVGYSLDSVAGQSLTYEITVDKIFKKP
jgi:hypothetical protein